MNMGECNFVFVLIYFFWRIEKCFDGLLSLIVFDEVWLMFGYLVFCDKICEWLKVF